MRKLWESFFENITTDNELDKFLRSISGKAIQDWEHDYQEYKDNSKQIIKRYFEESVFTENLELEGLKQDINWISLYAPICEKYVEEIKANINGFDFIKDKDKIRPHINFVFGGESGVYRRLSAMDNLIYFASLYRIIGDEAIKRAENLLKMVGLYENKDQLVETYSKGMIQRLQIARGLINNPEIILMDEPTIGLDPIGANKLRDIIKQIRKDGKTVLLTTHYMQEADDLCDNIAILSKGKIVALDSPQQLKKQFGKNGLNSTLEEVFINLVQEN